MKRASLLPAFFFVSFLVESQVPIFFPRTTAVGLEQVPKFSLSFGHGASAADFDNDGDIDFYITTAKDIANRLYMNNGDGTFRDVAVQYGVDIMESSRISLWFDYNGDHRLDLLVLQERCFKCDNRLRVYLFRQNEEGTFEDVSAASNISFGDRFDNDESFESGGLTAGDLNQDGWLDLIISVWGGGVGVFLNNGDGSFTDSTLPMGFGHTGTFYYQPAIHDFNQDGLPDIYLNVDYEENEFWLNHGDGTFSEIAAENGSDIANNEMGLSLGDYDNDGDMDIYCTNITQFFGGRYQHNILLQNDFQDGQVSFDDVSGEKNVHESGWDWGCTFLDFNNDGWLDLASTNGWYSNDINKDFSKLWMNKSGTFEDVSEQSRFDDALEARTLIAFDADRDGDLDLLQTLRLEMPYAPAILYENQLDSWDDVGEYLVVKPRMKGTNHFAIGSIVSVMLDSMTLSRKITAGTSFYGQEPAEAFFGIPVGAQVRDVRIDWPDGRISVYEGIEAGQEVVLMDETLEAPSDLMAISDERGFVISWTDNASNETGFAVHISSSADFAVYEQYQVAANETQLTLPLFDNRYLYCRVRAVNESVSSPFTQPVGTQIINSTPLLSPDQLFPNPLSGNLLTIRNELTGRIDLVAFDSSGKKVFTTTFVKSKEEISIEVNLKAGVHLIKMTDGVRTTSGKLMVK